MDHTKIPVTKGLPPLEKWHPEYSGEMDLVIKANGEWWHEGAKIKRQALVDLFASILWKETNTDGQEKYFLKTPVEKYGIQVEDVPLLITAVKQTEVDGVTWLVFMTQTGDSIRLDANHRITFKNHQGEQRLYMNVRRNLEALIHRNTFYQLVTLGELIEKQDNVFLQLYSGGEKILIQHL